MPKPRPLHPSGCCRTTWIAVFRASDLVDVLRYHHCGRLPEHVRPRDWWAAR